MGGKRKAADLCYFPSCECPGMIQQVWCIYLVLNSSDEQSVDLLFGAVSDAHTASPSPAWLWIYSFKKVMWWWRRPNLQCIHVCLFYLHLSAADIGILLARPFSQSAFLVFVFVVFCCCQWVCVCCVHMQCVCVATEAQGYRGNWQKHSSLSTWGACWLSGWLHQCEGGSCPPEKKNTKQVREKKGAVVQTSAPFPFIPQFTVSLQMPLKTSKTVHCGVFDLLWWVTWYKVLPMVWKSCTDLQVAVCQDAC